ncbi:MAG: ribose 5-phosphate isomerase B [Eubacteriales bacterium]|nr:ribose 5-phosphate isomerase B [Eubacteriales bacterium]MDD4390489.1 ribose 5-phosphate isomerase B [Eubacteriales bacterium]
MKIAIASDHGGFDLKEILIDILVKEGIEVCDLGTYGCESVDYPMFGKTCALKVAEGHVDKGIVVCGTGIGISIAANKVKGIRCALCTSTEMAELTRKHNDANMLALGGRILDTETAIEITKTWLKTEFEGGRHQRRVDMLNEM